MRLPAALPAPAADGARPARRRARSATSGTSAGHYLRSVSAAEDDDAAGVTGRIGPELVDVCRYLFGEIDGISAVGRRFGRPSTGARGDRRRRRVRLRRDRDFHIGRVASTHDRFALAIAGSRGTIAFDAEQLGELQVDTTAKGCARSPRPPGRTRRAAARFPDDHVVTARDAQALELAHLLTAISERRSSAPSARLLDGYHATHLWERLTAAASSALA